MLRSTLAILGGIAVILIASFAIEAAVTPLLIRGFPHALPDELAMSQNVPVLVFTFAYTFLCVVAGGYVTAAVARRLPERHALILGLIQSALTIPAMIAYRGKSPLWGWIVSMIAVIPAAWIGGLIYARRRK